MFSKHLRTFPSSSALLLSPSKPLCSSRWMLEARLQSIWLLVSRCPSVQSWHGTRNSILTGAAVKRVVNRARHEPGRVEDTRDLFEKHHSIRLLQLEYRNLLSWLLRVVVHLILFNTLFHSSLRVPRDYWIHTWLDPRCLTALQKV